MARQNGWDGQVLNYGSVDPRPLGQSSSARPPSPLIGLSSAGCRCGGRRHQAEAGCTPRRRVFVAARVHHDQPGDQPPAVHGAVGGLAAVRLCASGRAAGWGARPDRAGRVLRDGAGVPHLTFWQRRSARPSVGVTLLFLRCRTWPAGCGKPSSRGCNRGARRP